MGEQGNDTPDATPGTSYDATGGLAVAELVPTQSGSFARVVTIYDLNVQNSQRVVWQDQVPNPALEMFRKLLGR